MKAKKRIKKKKPLKKKFSKRPKQIGTITHYFGKIRVGIIKLSENLKVGDYIAIKGKKREFTQRVNSIQLNHVNINTARHGAEIGIKVIQKVHEGEKVFKARPPVNSTTTAIIAPPSACPKPPLFEYKPIMPAQKDLTAKPKKPESKKTSALLEKSVLEKLPFDRAPQESYKTPIFSPIQKQETVSQSPPPPQPKEKPKYSEVKFLKF